LVVCQNAGTKELKCWAPKKALFRNWSLCSEGEEVPIIDALFTAGCGAVGNYIIAVFAPKEKATSST
jgi:hypothetical protein